MPLVQIHCHPHTWPTAHIALHILHFTNGIRAALQLAKQACCLVGSEVELVEMGDTQQGCAGLSGLVQPGLAKNTAAVAPRLRRTESKMVKVSRHHEVDWIARQMHKTPHLWVVCGRPRPGMRIDQHCNSISGVLEA
eukprot:scaffold31696_cov139-Isochrysis_galbana.AAC.5